MYKSEGVAREIRSFISFELVGRAGARARADIDRLAFAYIRARGIEVYGGPPGRTYTYATARELEGKKISRRWENRTNVMKTWNKSGAERARSLRSTPRRN